MAGTGGINISRGGVEIWWEPGDYVGEVRIFAENMENGDIGVVKDKNDGKHFLTYPPGTYSDHVKVYKNDGGEFTDTDLIAEFDIVDVRIEG